MIARASWLLSELSPYIDLWAEEQTGLNTQKPTIAQAFTHDCLPGQISALISFSHYAYEGNTYHQVIKLIIEGFLLI